jgi:NhaA family Na+:H+ antiporter
VRTRTATRWTHHATSGPGCIGRHQDRTRRCTSSANSASGSKASANGTRRSEPVGLAEHFEHRFRPLSAGVAVPVFAFFAAGVTVVGTHRFGASLTDSITLGIVAALVVGKTVGVLGSTWLVQRFTHAQLAAGLSWWDVLGIALLGGVGFTVSLLIGELAFGAGTAQDDTVKLGVLLGSLLSALFAAVVLRVRNSVYRRLAAEEERDVDPTGDGRG